MVKDPFKCKGASMNNKSLMTEIEPGVLKKLQDTQIEIMKEIVRICEKHNLRYFLIYGTLIGAIRHKGFIPWDDDLDIGMPRDDYEKFIKVANQELGSAYYLQSTEKEPYYWLPFIKIRKNNTIFEEPSFSRMPESVHKGIFVDIFPFDYVQENKGMFVHLQFILSKAICETMYFKAGVYTDKQTIKYKKLFAVLNCLSMKSLSRIQNNISKLQNKEGAEYLADFNSSRNYLAAIYPIHFFFPVAEGDFEGNSFKIPYKYHEYLTMVYGDYMKLPKEEDRVNHRTLRIVFEIKKNE